MNIKEIYKKEINSVCFSNNFESVTSLRLIEESRRKGTDTLNKNKVMKTIILIAVLVALLSTSVYAVTYLLSAKEVAEKTGNSDVAKMFNEENFDIVTISDKGYCVSYHGIVNSEELVYFDSNAEYEDRTYAVYSIAKEDGTPLNLIDGMPLSFTPVIDGIRTDIAFALTESANGTEKDGILYYLFNYRDLEIFADKNVSVAVFEGFFPNPGIFTMDENGKTVYNESYSGFKGMFELSLDKSKADPKEAKRLLESMGF